MKKKVSIKVSYLVMYYFLSEYCEPNNSQHNDFAGLMGGWSPEIFLDGASADPAAISDWEEIVGEQFGLVKELSSSEIFITIINFLKFHVDEFDFNLKWLIDKIKNDYQNLDKWEKKYNSLIEFILS